MNKDNSGPAFPTDTEHQSGANSYHLMGMTRRQWLAGLAMQGILAGNTTPHESIPEQAYEIADKMLRYE